MMGLDCIPALEEYIADKLEGVGMLDMLEEIDMLEGMLGMQEDMPEDRQNKSASFEVEPEGMQDYLFETYQD